MTIFFSDLFLIERSQRALSKNMIIIRIWRAGAVQLLNFLPAFRFFPMKKSGCSLQSGQAGPLSIAILGWAYLH